MTNEQIDSALKIQGYIFACNDENHDLFLANPDIKPLSEVISQEGISDTQKVAQESYYVYKTTNYWYQCPIGLHHLVCVPEPLINNQIVKVELFTRYQTPVDILVKIDKINYQKGTASVVTVSYPHNWFNVDIKDLIPLT